MIVESSRRSRSMDTGGLPLVSTFALLTIVAGKCSSFIKSLTDQMKIKVVNSKVGYNLINTRS